MKIRDENKFPLRINIPHTNNLVLPPSPFFPAKKMESFGEILMVNALSAAKHTGCQKEDWERKIQAKQFVKTMRGGGAARQTMFTVTNVVGQLEAATNLSLYKSRLVKYFVLAPYKYFFSNIFERKEWYS